MTPVLPHTRRAEFDETVRGWGSDPAEVLSTRLDLIAELGERIAPFTQAENKVITAMTKRLRILQGGTSVAS